MQKEQYGVKTKDYFSVIVKQSVWYPDKILTLVSRQYGHFDAKAKWPVWYQGKGVKWKSRQKIQFSFMSKQTVWCYDKRSIRVSQKGGQMGQFGIKDNFS